MAGQITASVVQLGDSGTATQNFVVRVPAVPDGTMRIARGNAGSESADIMTVSSAGAAGFSDGTVGAPGISFSSDTDSGMYRIGANNIGVGVNGAKVLDVSTTGLGVTGTVLSGDGTVGAPGISFSSDTDSGIYRIGANNIGIGVNGANAIDISSSKISALNAYQKLSSSGTVVNINGTYHEIVSNFNNNVLVITNQNATLNTTISGINVYYSGAAPNSTTACFLYNEDTGGLRSSLRSNGGLANYSANNVNLSDERLKKDIVDAPSYYERWKQLQFRTFLYKDQTDSELNLGVIAQELETVCPELVSNDGFGETPPGEAPLKTVYQTDFQYATAKALQEAIAHIEQLEARLAALEAK